MAESERSGNRTKDARGRSVSLLDPVKLQVLHRYDTIDETALREIVEELEPGKARLRKHALIITLAGVTFLAVLIAAVYYFSDAGARADLVATLMNPAIMVPCVFGGVVAPWFAERRERMKRVCSVLLKHRRCPHCGYDLRGSPADPADHTTLCSECGCAWAGVGAQSADDEVAAGQLALTTRRSRAALVAAFAGLSILFALGLLFYMKSA